MIKLEWRVTETVHTTVLSTKNHQKNLKTHLLRNKIEESRKKSHNFLQSSLKKWWVLTTKIVFSKPSKRQQQQIQDGYQPL